MGADPCKVSILLEEWVQGSYRVECYAEAGYIVLALQAVLPKPPAEFQPSHSFLPGHWPKPLFQAYCAAGPAPGSLQGGKGVSWTHTVSLMPFKNWELLLLWSWSSSLTARFKIQIHIILRSILCHAFFAGCCFGLGKKGAPLFLELWFKYTNAPKLQLKTSELIQSVTT